MKNFQLFFLIIPLFLLVTFLSQNFLNSEELTYNFYAEQLAYDQIEQLLETQKKWEWVGYAVVPLIVLIRSSLVAMCLSVGLFFYDDENEYKFKKFLNITLWGELVLVSVGYVKLIYFAFIKTDYTLKDIQQYYPLSYTNFLDLEKIEPWLIYPLQTVNLFEITYFFVLVYGLHELLKNNFWRSFEITAVSYGTGLAIWLGLVSFLTLNYT